MNDSTRKWEEFLNPEVLRTKLITASMYLTAFELLKDSIIDRVKGFFTIGFDESGTEMSSEYSTEVLSLNKSRLYASLLWLKKQDAINDDDLGSFEAIRTCRNRVAHELQRVIAGDLEIAFVEQFSALISLLRKIEVWWIVNLEIPINSDFDNMEIDESQIAPGDVMMIQLMCEIALGEPEKAAYYFNEFRKRTNNSP
jgi:hypothetical protein